MSKKKQAKKQQQKKKLLHQQKQNRNQQSQKTTAAHNSNVRSQADKSDSDDDRKSLRPVLVMGGPSTTGVENTSVPKLSQTGPGGLPNLGNTCYFNSVMQVLGQTYIMHELLTARLKPDFNWNAKTYYLAEKASGEKYFTSEQITTKLGEAKPLQSTVTKLQQEIFQRL